MVGFVPLAKTKLFFLPIKVVIGLLHCSIELFCLFFCFYILLLFKLLLKIGILILLIKKREFKELLNDLILFKNFSVNKSLNNKIWLIILWEELINNKELSFSINFLSFSIKFEFSNSLQNNLLYLRIQNLIKYSDSNLIKFL